MAKKIELVGYCGLYCGTCASYTQRISNVAKELRRELRKGKLDAKIAAVMAKVPGFEAFKHYEKGYELLGAMMKIRCSKSCRQGGGPPGCQIKKCAKKKRLAGCWECDDFVGCKTLAVLEQFGDTDRSYLKNLRKIRRDGVAAYVKQKTAAGA